MFTRVYHTVLILHLVCKHTSCHCSNLKSFNSPIEHVCRKNLSNLCTSNHKKVMKMEITVGYYCSIPKRSFIKRQTSGTSSDNEWQRRTTSDNEWYNEWQRVVQQVIKNGTTGDKERQRVTTSGRTSDNEWHQMTTSGNEWYNEWQQVVQRVIKSSTTGDKEWQRVTKSDKEWQWVTVSESSGIANNNGTLHFKE